MKGGIIVSKRGSGSSAKKQIRVVNGVDIGSRLFGEYSEVTKLSQNTIWIENTSRPHAVLKNKNRTVQIQGDKKDKYGLLDNVNTAIVHLSGIDKSTPKREVTKLNKQLSAIRSMDFDVQRINVGDFETIAYIKRKLFTREF